MSAVNPIPIIDDLKARVSDRYIRRSLRRYVTEFIDEQHPGKSLPEVYDELVKRSNYLESKLGEVIILSKELPVLLSSQRAQAFVG